MKIVYSLRSARNLLIAVTALLPLTPAFAVPTASSADLVITDARIYVGTAGNGLAAMAVTDGRIVFIGSNVDAARRIGAATKVVRLHGARVLPGLVDAHIHPLDIVDLDVCDLDSKSVTLRELSAFVGQCVEHYHTPPGGRLIVHQWNYIAGNKPDADFPTLRIALDKASTQVKIQLLGNDGHHGGFNSLALAAAKNSAGRTVGLSKASLAADFFAYSKFVGVDERGEPNGAANEDARYLINANSMLNTDLDQVMTAPERVTQRLNSVGITAILDAMTAPESIVAFDTLQQRGQLTVRASLAQFYDPAQFHTPEGKVDYDAMVSKAVQIRSKYASNPLIRADFIKLFADGVTEGNPYAIPPTLPNAASLENYLQPIFGLDKQGLATVSGYVDTASAVCKQVRAQQNDYADAAVASRFLADHGYHPAQCTLSNGQLQHDPTVIREFVRRFHLAGFNMHIHVIGDRALRTALDAIEAARAADGNHATRDSLAHIQMSSHEDVVRVGQDHLYVAFTYAWMNVDDAYDITVIPFLQPVHGNTAAALHPPRGSYDRNAYPVRDVKNAGAILAAGSDAPVETRDPRPFVNIAHAITRRYPQGRVLNSTQVLTVVEAIDAYTINGARMLGIDKEAGSLEVGKSADFVVVDRDIVALARRGRADNIAKTRVLQTWFQGKQVYERPAAPATTATAAGAVSAGAVL